MAKRSGLVRKAIQYLTKAKKRSSQAKRRADGRMDNWGAEHVFKGHVRPNRKIQKTKGTGYHHRPGGEDMPGRRIDPNSAKKHGNNGVYSAESQFYDPRVPPPQGPWISKKGNGGRATFFPDDWDQNKVELTIRDAHKNGGPHPDPSKTNMWQGEANGVRVEGFNASDKPHGYSHGWPSENQP